MFYNDESRREKQEKSYVLTNKLLSIGSKLNNEDRGNGKVPPVDNKLNIIESNYNEYSRSIFASDNSNLRNHQQEKCSTERFMNSTQHTANAPTNPATTYDKLSNSTKNTHSKICLQLVKQFFLLFVLHTICNRLVTNVICDENIGYLDSNGHYTHTWVVHIPGGDNVADDVASTHGMILKGKVRENNFNLCLYIHTSYIICLVTSDVMQSKVYCPETETMLANETSSRISCLRENVKFLI